MAHRPRRHHDLAPQLAGAAASAAKPYDASDHALAPFAPDVAAAAAELAPLVTRELLDEVAADVPDEWLLDEPGFTGADEVRAAYVEALLPRAATIHERITLGPRTEGRPQQPPGWLADRLAPRPHPTQKATEKATEKDGTT